MTVADVAAMSDEQRQQLLDALLTHYAPNGFQALLAQSCDEAVKQYQQTIAAHKPNRFRRGANRFQRGDAAATLALASEPRGVRATPSQSRESRFSRCDDHAEHSGSVRTPTHATGDVPNSPSKPQPDPQHVNGRIPVNPILRHLDNPAAPNGSGTNPDNRWQTALHQYNAAVWKWKQ